MILLRVAGRFIRTERLFIEDKIAALAVIPLILRMVCVHFILIYGTNNADFSGVELTAVQLHQKSVASGLVLLSRFFYAATYVFLRHKQHTGRIAAWWLLCACFYIRASC